MAGRSRRAHTSAAGPSPFPPRGIATSQRRETAPPLSSNISQNYPYASETEVARRAVVADILSRFDGLAAKVQAETTPLDAEELTDVGAQTRWWIWICPKDDFAGRLHVAGYAIEKHALYTVCDTHGDTYLR